MNLGQLIDPTWVQDGRRERFPRRRPEDQAAVTCERPLKGPRLAILQILAAAPEAVSCRAVSQRLGEEAGLDISQVSAYLSALADLRYVEKLGTERPFAYRITAIGRERLR